MKPGLILLVCPAFFIVSCNAQSHRFAQPFRSRRINPIETTDATEESREDQNNANTDNNIEVKRLIDLMKVSDGVNEPGNKLATKAVRHKSKKKKVPSADRSVSKQSRNGVGQVRREPVINVQHSVQKVRNRGRQIPTRIANPQLSGSIQKTDVGEDKYTNTKKFRIKDKSQQKISRNSANTILSESGEHTYPTERIIIRVPKIELEDSSTENILNDKIVHRDNEINMHETLNDSDKANSLSFLKTFLKSYEKNSATTTVIPKVTIPSKQDRDLLLSNMLNSDHKLTSDVAKEINDINIVDDVDKNIKKQRKESERRNGVPSDSKASLTKRLRNKVGLTERGRGQRRPSSNQSEKQNSEVKATAIRGRGHRRPSSKQSEEQTSELKLQTQRRRGQGRPSSTQSDEQTSNVKSITTRVRGQRRPTSKISEEQTLEVKSITPTERSQRRPSSLQSNEQTSEVRSTTIRGRGQRRPSPRQSSTEVPAPSKRNKGQRKQSARQSEEQTIEETLTTTRRKSQKNSGSTQSEDQISKLPAAIPRRRSHKRPSSGPSAEQSKEVTEATQTNTPVFRSNKQTINNIYNIIEQAEHMQSDIIRKSEEIRKSPYGRKNEQLKISGNDNEPVQEKSIDETATNTSLERKPSNLFLSTFMGIQRTKRPQIAPNKINLSDKDEDTEDLKVTQTEPLPKAEPKFPYSHRFGAGVAKHASELDISNEERPIPENVLDISRTRPLNHALPNTRGRNSLFSRKPFRPVGKTQKTEVNQLRSELEETETSNSSNEIELGQTENVSEPSVRFDLSARGRSKNSFQHPKSNIRGKPKSETSSKSSHTIDESSLSNEEGNASLPTQSEEESSLSHVSAARFNTRGRGRPKTEEDNLKTQETPAPPPVFLPTQRPVPALRKINYSEIVRHGQGRPTSIDIGKEVTDKKLKSSQVRHGVRGRGRPKDTARNIPLSASNEESLEDIENRTENLSFQSPLRSRFSIPETRKSRPHIKTKPPRFSPTSSTAKVKTQDIIESVHINTNTFPTADPAYSTTPQLHRFGSDSGTWEGILIRPEQKENTSIGSQPQSDERESIIGETGQEIIKASSGSKLEQRGRISSELPEQIEVTTETRVRGRTRGSHVRKQEDDQKESKKDKQLRGRSKGSSIRKHEEVKPVDSSQNNRRNEVKTENKQRGRLRKEENERADFSKEGRKAEYTEVRAENQVKSRTRGSLVRKQEEVETAVVSQEDDKNEVAKENHLRSRLRGSQERKHGEVLSENQHEGRLKESLARNQAELTVASEPYEDAGRYHERERLSPTIKEVEKTEQNLKSNSNQRSRSRSRGRQNALPKSVEKVQQPSPSKSFRPQAFEYQRQPTEEFIDNQELQRNSDIKSIDPESREILFTENVKNEESLLTFDPFTTSGPLETVLTYNFFPADTEHSKENFKVHVLDKPDIETVSEDLSDADLSDHLSSALNLATVTWTQDPYREEEEEAEGRPVFDIDFSKNPNQ